MARKHNLLHCWLPLLPRQGSNCCSCCVMGRRGIPSWSSLAAPCKMGVGAPKVCPIHVLGPGGTRIEARKTTARDEGRGTRDEGHRGRSLKRQESGKGNRHRHEQKPKLEFYHQRLFRKQRKFENDFFCILAEVQV